MKHCLHLICRTQYALCPCEVAQKGIVAINSSIGNDCSSYCSNFTTAATAAASKVNSFTAAQLEQSQYNCSLVALLLFRIKHSSEPGPSTCVPESSSASHSKQAAASEAAPKAVCGEGAELQLTSRRSHSSIADVLMPAKSADNGRGGC